MTSIPFRAALLFWFKLGFISFGGPAGQIAILHQELVERRGWISERRFLHALNYCMVLPGPEAQQLATYLGWLMHRTWGGILAGVLFVMPSLCLLVGLAWIYVVFSDAPIVAGLFYGIKPAVTAIVLHAAWRVGRRVLVTPALCALAAAAFVATVLLNLPFPAIVIGAAAMGYAAQRWMPTWIAVGTGHGTATRASRPAIIDDTTPTPPHAEFRSWRLTAIVVAGLILWAAPFLLLIGTHGWDGTLSQMAWFFTKAALLTFGGAYAVLPYVYQGAVVQYGWVTAGQMIDGLALGESTPGPLIMVVVFVAFVGGYSASPLGPDRALASGILAALVVTWFTFLPSFLFILAGGPLVEGTHGNLRLQAPLTAITAAVVGVILNLSLFLGFHVGWPSGFEGGLDGVAAAIAVAAGVALFYFDRSILSVIAASALAGLVISMLSW